MARRIRKGVSLGQDTVRLLDDMVASGTAENVSAAIDLVVADYARRRADADLIQAASVLDVGSEEAVPGVVGGEATWESLQ